MVGTDYDTVGSVGSRMGKGIFITKTAIIIYTCVVVAVLLAEGLIIGLVARPDCEAKVEETSTTKPTVATTTTASGGDTTSTTTTTGEMGPWTEIRLPDTLIPDDYVVELRPVLTPDGDGKYWFHGTSTVGFWCQTPTKHIMIHSNKLDYNPTTDVSLKMGANEVERVDSFLYVENQYLVIETVEECTQGQYYTLTVNDFKGELADDLDGLYRSEYVNSDGKNIVIATTQMQATGARKTFPCFDEPALRANFTIKLWYIKRDGYSAISNMPPDPAVPQETQEIDGDTWTLVQFEESVPMPTYLLAMVVSDFAYVENTTVDGIQTRIYGRREFIDVGDGDYSALITPHILDFFADYFDVPYPLNKSDQIGVPDFGAGAMENWGLVIYREPYILYNESTSTVNYKLFLTSIVSHELAHQWFGNLVTLKWWDELWLNEGFATYVSYLGEADVQPTWQSMERFITDDLQRAFSVDELTSSRPLVLDVNTPAEISAQFDTISYSKGGSILRMINDFLGDTFVKGLTNYINDKAYGSATHDDLFAAWSEQAQTDGLTDSFPTDLAEILETWTLQMGFPVVNIRKQGPLTDMYTITQEYFLIDDEAEPVQTEGSITYGYKWYIPFRYSTGGDLANDQITWLSPDGVETIPLSGDDGFILGNYKAVGYYRVNYDDDTWDRIATRLQDETRYMEFPQENRAQLLDDAFSLASANRLDIVRPLEMSKFLSHDVSLIAWETFTGNIKYFEYMLGRTPVFGTFSNFILELVVPSIYTQYGWEEDDTSDEALIERLTSQVAIYAACYYGYSECISNATDKYARWMESPDEWNIIDSSFRSDILCTAIRNGGTAEWNFAWERHNATSDASWATSLRYGMACSKDPWILNRYLEYTLDPTKIRKQDAIRTMEYVGREEYGRDVAWAFVVNNWSELVAAFGGGWSFDGLIASITRRFSTEYDLQLLEDFKETTDDLATAVRAVDQAIERTKVNIKWRAANEETVTQWLYDNVNNNV